MTATLELARLLISPESNLKEIDAFEDAAHAIACGYINLHNDAHRLTVSLGAAILLLREAGVEATHIMDAHAKYGLQK